MSTVTVSTKYIHQALGFEHLQLLGTISVLVLKINYKGEGGASQLYA